MMAENGEELQNLSSKRGTIEERVSSLEIMLDVVV